MLILGRNTSVKSKTTQTQTQPSALQKAIADSKADFDICKEAKLDPNEQDAKKITEALQKLLAKLQYQKNNRKITQQEYIHKYPIVNTVLSAIKPTQTVSKPVTPAPQSNIVNTSAKQQPAGAEIHIERN